MSLYAIYKEHKSDTFQVGRVLTTISPVQRTVSIHKMYWINICKVNNLSNSYSNLSRGGGAKDKIKI